MVILVAPVEKFRPHPRNVRKHPEKNIQAIIKSLEEFGQQKPIVVDKAGQVICGNGTFESIKRMGWASVQYIQTNLEGAKAEAFAIADNKTTDMSIFDEALLAEVLKDLEGEGIDLASTGFQKYELNTLFTQEDESPRIKLTEKFIIPPFSVLDARQGYWQERKRLWIALGIKGELGRDGHGKPAAIQLDNYDYKKYQGNEAERKAVKVARPAGRHLGQDLMKGENKNFGQLGGSGGSPKDAFLRRTAEGYKAGEEGMIEGTGTSIFDPVLAEICYRWFTPEGGKILDPFAGESTKGIVAGVLGYDYFGVEFRKEQVDENRQQAVKILTKEKEGEGNARWVQGDSATLSKYLPPKNKFDLVFTSPPYYDLEQYSDDSKDGSAKQTYEEFISWYETVFYQAVEALNTNRFLVVKVGEIRDKKTGAYRSFVPDNCALFTRLGLTYYNEMILVTAVGSLPVRITRQMASGRKIGKTHQNILVFYKGDPRGIKDHFKPTISGIDFSGETDTGESNT